MGIGVGIVSVKLVAMMAVLVVSVSLLTPAISAADPVAGDRLCFHYSDGTEDHCGEFPDGRYFYVEYGAHVPARTLYGISPTVRTYLFENGSKLSMYVEINSLLGPIHVENGSVWKWSHIENGGGKSRNKNPSTGRFCGTYDLSGQSMVWAHDCRDAMNSIGDIILLAKQGRIAEAPFPCNYHVSNQVIACKAQHGCMYAIGASRRPLADIKFTGKTYTSKRSLPCTRISFS